MKLALRAPSWRPIVLAFWLLAAAAAHAVFPDRPVHIIVPVPPGGLADTQARMLGEKLSRRWMRPVITASLYRNLPYHALQSFHPVSLIGTSPFVVVARPSLAAGNVAELIQLAARSDGGLTYATSGIGTAPHLTGELVRFNAMARFMHVPYKGTAEALSALEGGHVDFAILDISVASLVDAGTLKAIAVTTAGRSSRLPEVKTLAEQGITGCDVAYWSGLLVPAGTPRAVIAQLNAAVREALGTDDVRSRFDALGFRVIASSPEDYADLMAVDYDGYAKTIRITGVKPD